MQQIRKMGSLTKIMGMLPGMGQFRDQLENFDEKEIDRIQAIIQSMTPGERENPKMIDGSRRLRISKGSGTQVSDVNTLVDRFFEARKMMQQMARGGGMPGMPGMGGGAGKGKQKKQQQGKKKRVSGNPAKAAAQQAAAKEKAASSGANPYGGADGVDYDTAAANLDLPTAISKLLKLVRDEPGLEAGAATWGQSGRPPPP